ncbi:putative nudix domain-containing protein [Rosellinia necatrix]|uniref:Putative nudix domain-containing protein n=1 Tax=Rosellinia necatrix TaxID=77044 RepID=A0A1S7UJF4_ROSNE|nr:putative nudix domain-containing protein [Rosellinia necatrix]
MMDATATNGDADAASTPSSSRGDSQKQSREPTRSPPTPADDGDLLEPAETAEARQSFTDPSAILPADLALALALDLQQASSSSQPSPSQQEEQEEQEQHEQQGQRQQRTLAEAQLQASYYWDASTMAPLSTVSAAAVARLRAYKPPPFPIWDRLPVSRRAAVLILLFADRMGDLRVVITMRAASLRNFSGHAAFPGGKADSLNESPYQIARREAWEEIGLPLDDGKIPSPFRIEPLCSLPCSLAKTELVVRPCVAFLHSEDKPGSSPAPTVDEAMMPRLDAKEVAAVFSAPFANFLRSADEAPRPGDPPLPPGHWYDGRWINWQSDPWRVHNFHVPVHAQRVTTPKVREGGLEALAEEDEPAAAAAAQRFLVWGMTGRILVDAARIAYAREPEFEHNANYGDEALIGQQVLEGRLTTEKKRKEIGLDATREEVKDAKI